MSTMTNSDDYVEYYRRVKEFGAKQSWDTKKINKMLGDKAAFDKEYKLVSGRTPSSFSSIGISAYPIQIHCFNLSFQI